METGHLALLLLPAPPSLLSATNTKAAYGPGIDGVLSQLNGKGHCRLDIAISVPPYWLTSQEISRTSLFERAQKTLAQTYSLIGATATKQQIELDCADGVDARVFFLLPKGKPANEPSQGNGQKPYSGPYVDVNTLIECQRPYRILYGVESEEGEKLMKSFLDLYESKHRHYPTCRRVPGGLSITNLSAASEGIHNTEKAHTSVAVGGTFDHLHVGHKLLLTATALLAEPKGSHMNSTEEVLLIIGISGDDLLTQKKFAEQMENWEERQRKVADFLESIIVFEAPGKIFRKAESISNPGPHGRYVRVTFDSAITIEYVRILDPFGPTITKENISALVVSQETMSGGKAVNEKRQEKGWTPLEIFKIDVLEVNPSFEDDKEATSVTSAFESKISSTEIRRRICENTQS